MRALILALALLAAAPCRAVETDKVAHAGISYFGTALVYGLGKQLALRNCRAVHPLPERCSISQETRVLLGITAAALVFVGGFVKENLDSTVDRVDIIANGVGAAAGSFNIITFEF